jgi:hypothetical protein
MQNMIELNEILNMQDRAEAYYHLVEYFTKSSDAVREKIRSSWDFGKKWVYANPFYLARELPNHRPCYERIKASLMYYAIAGSKVIIDVRDDLIGIAQLYQAAIVIGHDPDVLFEEVAQLSDKGIASLLRDYTTRDDYSKSLEVFGWSKVIDKEGQVTFQHEYITDLGDWEK